MLLVTVATVFWYCPKKLAPFFILHLMNILSLIILIKSVASQVPYMFDVNGNPDITPIHGLLYTSIINDMTYYRMAEFESPF